MTNPYADAALEYHNAGWLGPLPFPYGDKFPPPVGRTGRSAQYPTAHDIEIWRTTKKQQNIGLRCAEIGDTYQIIGIDVDHYTKGDRKKTGFTQLRELEERLGPLPNTWVATARIDGKSGIRFFLAPRDIYFPGEVDEDIEIIQKRHRYAMVWPSLHPEGGTYWWYAPGVQPTKKNQLKWNRAIPNAATLPLLPESWIDFLTEHRTLIDDTTDIDLDSSVDEIETWAAASFSGDETTPPCGLMEKHLHDAIKKVQNATTFHPLLTNAHWDLLKLAEAGHQGWQQALDEYKDAYKDAVIAHDGGTTGRTYGELRSEIFRSRIGALRKIKGSSLGIVSSCQIIGCPGEKNLSGDFQKDVEYELYRLEVRDEARRQHVIRDRQPLSRTALNLGELLKQPPNKTPMRITKVLPDGGRNMFSAPYKAGKTTAIGNLIRSLVDGDSLFNAFQVNKTAKRLVLIDTEMSQDMLREELEKQRIKNIHAVVDVICLRGQVSSFNLVDEQCRAEWAAHLQGLRCDYLILDCLRPVLDALGLDENRETGKFLDPFDALLSETNIPDATMVHHMGHANERARGDSRLQDWPDSIWKIVRENPNDDFSPRLFTATGRRNVEVPEGELKYDKETGHLTYAPHNRSDIRAQRRADKTAQERRAKTDIAYPVILKILKSAKQADKDGVSENQIVTEATKTPEVTRQGVLSALKTGAENGELAFWRGSNRSKMYAIGEILSNDD